MWWSDSIAAMLRFGAAVWFWTKVIGIVLGVLGLIALLYWLDHLRFTV